MSDELQEKFVADDGVSSVEDPVTPKGGTAKKHKADVAKKVDPTPEKVAAVTPGMKEDAEAADAEVVVEEVVELDESISAMFEGMDLSEEFKSKVTLVFEAAVNESAAAKAAKMNEEYSTQLDEEMKSSIDSTVNGLVENLDSYLDYVVEEWMTENEVAIEAGIKVEMAESLMDGLKGLFEEHNIAINEDTVDVVAELEEEVEGLKTDANTRIDENIALQKEITSLQAGKVFAEVTEDLTLTQQERMKVLAEKLDFDNIEEYTANLNTLKESFFAEAKAVTEDANVEEDEIIVEDTVVAKPASDHYTVNALVEALNAKTHLK
jgi:hypothetical protein